MGSYTLEMAIDRGKSIGPSHGRRKREIEVSKGNGERGVGRQGVSTYKSVEGPSHKGRGWAMMCREPRGPQESCPGREERAEELWKGRAGSLLVKGRKETRW